MQVICINTSYPTDWIYVEEEDFLEVGQIYTVEEVIENEKGRFYYLVEKPSTNHLWRVRYNANRFIIVPGDGDISKIEIPEIEELSEEEDFIRKMKHIGLTDESIQLWLSLIKKKNP